MKNISKSMCLFLILGMYSTSFAAYREAEEAEEYAVPYPISQGTHYRVLINIDGASYCSPDYVTTMRINTEAELKADVQRYMSKMLRGSTLEGCRVYLQRSALMLHNLCFKK